MKTDKIKSLLRSDSKKILIYHTDLDGICSAVLLLKFFKDFETIPRDGPIMDRRFVKELIAKKPDLIVALDIPVDQEWKIIEKIQQVLPEMRLVVIDHHIPDKNLNSVRNIHINPRFDQDVYIPTSCLVYRLLQGFGLDVKRLVWIATLGVIGDYGFEDCKDLIDECEDAYPKAIGKDPLKSNLRNLSEFITAAFVLHGIRGVQKSLEILLKLDHFAKIAENKYFSSCKDKVTKEIRRVLSDFAKRKKEDQSLDLVIYRIESRLNIASTISTLVAEKHPDKIILITKHSGPFVKISARYQAGDISLNDLMKTTVEGIGSGGGHEKAAGAVINRKDWKEFERRLTSEITRLRN